MMKNRKRGHRPCKSRFGTPSRVFGLRIPEEYIAFIRARIERGAATTLTDYLLSLIKADAANDNVEL